jgi:hypothetical protein
MLLRATLLHLLFSRQAFSLWQMVVLPLLRHRSWLGLVLLDGMQHDLVGVLRVVARMTLAPVVRNGIREDAAVPVECSSRNGSSNRWIALETVLGVLVPVDCKLWKLRE